MIKMRKQNLFKIVCLFALALLSQILTGCSGLDSLKICNNYSVSVYVWDDTRGFRGTVKAHTTQVFAAAAGYRGDHLKEIRYRDVQGRILGPFDEKSPNVEKEDNPPFGVTKTWAVTLGPAKPAGFFSSPFFATLTSPGVLVLLALVAFGFWNWKNTLTKRR